MSNTTAERSIQVNGTQIRCLEAGQGSPVVILWNGEGNAESPLQTLLAQQFRVIVLEIPELPSQETRKIADTLNQAVASISLGHYVLIGSAGSAPAALWQAIDGPDHIDGLVLISPNVLLPEGHTTAPAPAPDSALTGRLGDVQAPTLVLFGTNDAAIPPETGRMYVEQLPDCYYALMYDAGQDIETERPQALYEAVCDFVERRGTFIVERNSTAINP
jgi:pimeloyl-ACP methyl ester carboxylesterase